MAYIVFEGPEGGGKDTQIGLLIPWLETKGHRVACVKEPGGTAAGLEIRKILLHTEGLGLHGLTEACLFSADRAQLILERVQPALAKGFIVISNRCYYATLAYQGYGRGRDLKQLRALTQLAIGETRPNIAFLLDLDVEKGIARKHTQHEVNRLDKEDVEFHEKVRRGYHELVKQEPLVWHVINAENSIEQVQKDIRTVLERLL